MNLFILLMTRTDRVTDRRDIYNFLYGSACGSVRQYEYHSALPHLLPSMFDFIIDSFTSSLDISHVHTI